MTPLRKNLDRAKASYGEIRYRGDLARDVLGAMAVSTPVANPWRRRAMAIAAAVALSATTFFAGSYFERSSATHTEEVAVVTPTEKPVVKIIEKPKTVVATAAQAGDFTLVPTLASANSSQAGIQTASATSDFSLSVPSAPMLFSLATLADQETQTDSATDGTAENRS
jgi:hypothetical protein